MARFPALRFSAMATPPAPRPPAARDTRTVDPICPILSFATDMAIQDGLDAEADILAATTTDGRPRIHIWTSRPALAAAHGDRRLAGYEQVCEQFRAKGIAVAARQSGGETVVLGKGVIAVALTTAEARTTMINLAHGYRNLHAFIKEALAGEGMAIDMGFTPGSYCDGRYNIMCNGLKIAGTAQQQKTGAYRGILTHAAIMVDCDIEDHMRQIREFYAACGHTRYYDPTVCATIAQFWPVSEIDPVDGIFQRLIKTANRYGVSD